MKRLLQLFAAVAMLGLSACRDPGFVPAGRVALLNGVVQTEAAGSLLVREIYTLAPDATGTVRFRRSIGADRADGVELVSAEADGMLLTAGSDGLEVLHPAASALEVRWSPRPESRERRLTLTLRAIRAIAVTEPRAGLTWQLLPPRRGHAVDRVEVSLVLPTGAATYAGTGMLEAGWDVASTSQGINATKAPVTDGESATLVAAFDFNRTGVADPVWERNLDRQRQFLPALLAAALFFFVIGAGTLVILRAQFPPKKKLARIGRPGPADLERQHAARGLTIAGIAGAGAAAVSAGIAATALWFLGGWVQIIPASMLLVSAVFVLYAPRLRR